MSMLETRFLSGKMSIRSDYGTFPVSSQNQARFYRNYSSFVLKALRRVAFQKFLKWMLKKEQIEKQAVKAVHVKVLPLRNKHGKGIAGQCDPVRGRIQIYPKTSSFCKLFKRKFGRKALLLYAGNRARAALIHELLHLKYMEDEKTVRALAQEYFRILTQKKYAQNTQSPNIYVMIFNAKRSGSVSSPRVFCDSIITPKLA